MSNFHVSIIRLVDMQSPSRKAQAAEELERDTRLSRIVNYQRLAEQELELNPWTPET